MEIFKAVAEAGKFSSAADNLNLSKSAVSQSISDLEAYLGTQLINRSNRKFQLTGDGENFYRHCCHILSELRSVENIYRQEKSVIDGHISITAPISFGVSRISPLLNSFILENPEVQISLSLAEHNMDLVQAGLDIAVRIGHLQSNSLTARKLFDVKLVLTSAPDYLANAPEIKTIADLDNVNTLRYRWTPKWNFIRDGKSYSFTPKGHITSDSGEALLEFTAGGQGLSLLPDFIVENALNSGKIVRVLPGFEGEILPVHLVYPPSRHRPARVNKLSEYLIEGFSKLSTPES